MKCQLPVETIDEVIGFHGHSCPGLAIGIRASELMLRELGDLPGADSVCITETDMCGVDAVQYLTGCTVGKGNLIHRDVGKMAFTFFNRTNGKGFRCLLKTDESDPVRNEMVELQQVIASGDASDEAQARCAALKQQLTDRLMTSSLDSLFATMAPLEPMPRSARILTSLVCAACGESTMESRTRRFAGQTLCQPCFDKVEQKI